MLLGSDRALHADSEPGGGGGERDEFGWRVHRVASPYQAGETRVHVLLPEPLPPGGTCRVLYLLPVEPGAGSRWGDPRREVQRLDLHQRHGLICVYPTFTDWPWYCDHPDDDGLRQESHFLRVVVPLVEERYPARREGSARLLVGFSKSGWGAFSLLLRHPDGFHRAAAWDAPLAMQAPNRYGMERLFATQEHFERYAIHRLLRSQAERLGDQPRLIHMGFGNFREQHAATERLLNELAIPHVYCDGPQRRHAWDSGWLPAAVWQLVH